MTTQTEPLAYMERSRQYYAAQGYQRAYVWPVCHQTVSLIAPELETSSIPTVILGSVRDIVEHYGVPRFVFTDFPPGNPCGKPWDRDTQRDIVNGTLDVLAQSTRPRTTVQMSHRWPTEIWRRRFMEVREDSRQDLLAKGEAGRAAAKSSDAT